MGLNTCQENDDDFPLRKELKHTIIQNRRLRIKVKTMKEALSKIEIACQLSENYTEKFIGNCARKALIESGEFE